MLHVDEGAAAVDTERVEDIKRRLGRCRPGSDSGCRPPQSQPQPDAHPAPPRHLAHPLRPAAAAVPQRYRTSAAARRIARTGRVHGARAPRRRSRARGRRSPELPSGLGRRPDHAAGLDAIKDVFAFVEDISTIEIDDISRILRTTPIRNCRAWEKSCSSAAISRPMPSTPRFVARASWANCW